MAEPDYAEMMQNTGGSNPPAQATTPEGFGPAVEEYDETADPADVRRLHFDTGHGHPGHFHPDSPLHIESDDDLL
jgi:hypothetical protein